MMTHQFEKYLQLGEKTYFNRLGKVVKIVGLTIESVGPDAKRERPRGDGGGSRIQG